MSNNHFQIVAPHHSKSIPLEIGLVLQQKKKKYIFFKWVQPAVRHRLTYIKMFVLTSSLRKPVLTSWHFGAGGDILGQKHAFFDRKMRKNWNYIIKQ